MSILHLFAFINANGFLQFNIIQAFVRQFSVELREKMKIACLGWGSLIWNSGGLPIIDDWKNDGPMLPVEFARQSNNGRITLVIVPEKKPVQSLWVLLSSSNLSDAKEALT